MHQWLARLESQITTTVPNRVKDADAFPTAQLVRRWVRHLQDIALRAVGRERPLAPDGLFSLPTAKLLQQAVIASMVVGSDQPPLRVSLVKSLCTPEHSLRYGCTDQDCRRHDCLGDRLVLNDSSVVLYIVHHKNDRRQFDQRPTRITLPDSPMTACLKAYLSAGRDRLLEVAWSNENPVTGRLFLSGSGAPFKDSTFVHYWSTLMATAKEFGLNYFPPTAARTIFIEDFTRSADAEDWPGAAIVMGNSVRQWIASYWPSRRNRLAQSVVDRFSQYVSLADLEDEEADMDRMALIPADE